MSRLITTTVIALSLVCATAAFAQSSTRSQTGTMSRSSGGVPPAPVGHRQPSQADVSAAESKDNKGLLGADADDKALDRKIKSICRGC
jgi:hypothetical protein